jgi:manganese-dependent inorganic pyrophosphatase
MAVYIFGHKSPDSDTVCGAIALADLKSKLGTAATPVTQEKINPESKFILEKYGFSAPEIMTSFAGKQVMLVDFSDLAQGPADLAKADILAIVDHHKLGDVTTPNPLECWIWPVGCSCTVLKSMYDFAGVEIPKNIAGIMLCAILSDTVIFKSATCTDKDKEAAKALATIAGEDNLDALGMEMFKVKSAVAGTPVRELVMRDYKDFNMSNKKVGIGQLEVIDLAILDDVKEALAKDIKVLKEEGGRHSVFLLLTDIMKEGSEILFACDDPAILEKAFGATPQNGTVWLPGVMSRKKQVVPYLEKAFAG